jgi:hypothetical protein
VNIPSRSLTPEISTALYRRGQEFYLLAVNYGNEGKAAEVQLDAVVSDTPCWRVRNLMNNQEWTLDLRSSNRLTFPVPRKDGLILQLRGTRS